MARFVWFIVIISILSACTSSAQPTPDIDSLVSGTVDAQQMAFFQPQLLEPADETVFANPADVVLHWSWVRALNEGEFFDVRVWKDGQPDYGITWTQDSSFSPAEWLSQQEAGEFYWSIAVVKGADGKVESVLGEPPSYRRFTISSNQLPTATPEPSPTPILADKIIKLPAGFSAQLFAHVAETPTAITDIQFTPDGDLLVLAIDGRIFRLRDTNGDGIADQKEQILANDESTGVTFKWTVGMAFYEDRLYLSDEGRIGYLRDTNGDGVFDEYTSIFEDLPGQQYVFHSNNGIIFGSDNKLYVAVGATSDHGPLQAKYEASILRMNPDGSDVEVFATGFRNPYDLTFSPNQELFTADNSPDKLDSVMPFYPPEELDYIREGRDYGFPDVYGNGITIRPHSAETEFPVALIPTSSVSSGLVYYAADQFPEQYQNGVFVALYGGFNGQGRKVIFVGLQATEDGGYTGVPEDFATFRVDKPVDLTVGPDGALYVVSWEQGNIFRITYTGDS